MADCSPSAGSGALSALAENVGRSDVIRQPIDEGSQATDFRTGRVPRPIGRKPSTDWRQFVRPGTDLITGSSSASSFASGSSPRNATLSDWLDTFHRSSDTDTEWLDEDGRSENSHKWSPEVQTFVEVNRAIASSPALSASSYECPTPDEAEQAFCSPRGRSRSHGSTANCDSSAHPLTLHPSPMATWNHDSMFSQRRRWFGGRRVSTAASGDDDGDDGPASTPGHSSLGSGSSRQRSLSRTRSRLCQEIKIAPPTPPEVVEPDAETIIAAHAKLRETAMSRLSGILNHLGMASSAPSTKSSSA